MSKTTLKCLVFKEGEYYVSRCLNVEVASFGETRKEAIANLEEALELYFEDEPKPEITKVERANVISLKMQHA